MEVYFAVNTDKDVVALIKGDFEFHGEGNNCGWYSSEYLTDCNVIATMIINETDSEIEYYLRKKKSHYDVLQIESLYQGCKFVADNDGYAIKMLWDMVCHAYDEGNSCWWDYINPSVN